ECSGSSSRPAFVILTGWRGAACCLWRHASTCPPCSPSGHRYPMANPEKLTVTVSGREQKGGSMNRQTLVLFVTLFFAARPAMAQGYEFAVEHNHTIGNCRGRLIITPERIEYRTEYKEHSRDWRYTDLRRIKIVSPKKIDLASYEDRKWRMGLDRVF